MTDFISAADAAQSANYGEQRQIRDEVAEMAARLRREMDAGLSTDDMKVARAEQEAIAAAQMILEKLFK